MADVGFRRDGRHLHVVAHAALAELGVEDHREFVGRSIARRALHCTDHDRARIAAECLERVIRAHGVIDMADRCAVLVRDQSLDLVEGEVWAGCDDEVVVGDATRRRSARRGVSAD